MEIELLDIPTAELLEKFGAGKAKPGSGSAAAFQGMLASKLLITVISLTNRPDYQKTFSQVLPKLLEYQNEIEKKIFPELCQLFAHDAVEFDKVIEFRTLKKNEKDPIIQNQLRRQSLEQMKVAIAIPLDICNLSIELCEIANYVFDNAFKAARGDSHVAFSSAVSGLAGSLAIIRLNLLQFGSDDFRYCEEIRSKLVALDVDYTNYNLLATSKITVLQREYDRKLPFYLELNDLIDKLKSKINPTNSQIEEGIREFQNLVWRHKDIIWKKPPTSSEEILNPERIFKDVLCYDFVLKHEFGIKDEFGKVQELMGFIDQEKRLVAISSKLPIQVQRFTAAHELIHALFHVQSERHRELPEDRYTPYEQRDPEEKVADRGATYFLLPKKEIIKKFELRFKSLPFIINEHTTFNLTRGNVSDLRKKYRNRRELSRGLSTTESYNGVRFNSLADEFKVSTEAMAIRLEELGLVLY